MIINTLSNENTTEHYTPIGHGNTYKLQGTRETRAKGSIGEREPGGLVHRAI